jgi:hypothetical protein
VCLSDIREETGTYSCILFVGRCTCLISGRRQAPIFMLSVCWQVCLSDIREETGTYSCFLFIGWCACLILRRRQAPIHAFCLFAGVPVCYQGGDRHLFILSVCWQVCLSVTKEETGTYSFFLFVGRCACLISGRRQEPPPCRSSTPNTARRMSTSSGNH